MNLIPSIFAKKFDLVFLLMNYHVAVGTTSLLLIPVVFIKFRVYLLSVKEPILPRSSIYLGTMRRGRRVSDNQSRSTDLFWGVRSFSDFEVMYDMIGKLRFCKCRQTPVANLSGQMTQWYIGTLVH
jgi:hypothetical protein